VRQWRRRCLYCQSPCPVVRACRHPRISTQSAGYLTLLPRPAVCSRVELRWLIDFLNGDERSAAFVEAHAPRGLPYLGPDGWCHDTHYPAPSAAQRLPFAAVRPRRACAPHERGLAPFRLMGPDARLRSVAQESFLSAVAEQQRDRDMAAHRSAFAATAAVAAGLGEAGQPSSSLASPSTVASEPSKSRTPLPPSTLAAEAVHPTASEVADPSRHSEAPEIRCGPTRLHVPLV